MSIDITDFNFEWQPSVDFDPDIFEWTDFKMPKIYREKSDNLGNRIKSMFSTDNIDQKALFAEILQDLVWGVSHPANIGITTLWLQQVELLGTIRRAIGIDGTKILFDKLYSLSTSQLTKYNLLHKEMSVLLSCIDVDIPVPKEHEIEHQRICLVDESVFYVPKGNTVQYLEFLK